MKKIIVLLIACLFMITGCGEEKKESEDMKVDQNPIVTMSIKDYGDIKIELYPNENVYNTVANFVNLIEDGFYDDNYINRVQAGFVIQGGAGKPINYSIKGEFKSNGVNNNITHEKGVISMARATNPDSAGGQFFICLNNVASSLDGNYAAFGKVIEGLDIIDEIAKAKYTFADGQSGDMGFIKNSKDYIIIEKTTVETFGHTYKVNKVK